MWVEVLLSNHLPHCHFALKEEEISNQRSRRESLLIAVLIAAAQRLTSTRRRGVPRCVRMTDSSRVALLHRRNVPNGSYHFVRPRGDNASQEAVDCTVGISCQLLTLRCGKILHDAIPAIRGTWSLENRLMHEVICLPFFGTLRKRQTKENFCRIFSGRDLEKDLAAICMDLTFAEGAEKFGYVLLAKDNSLIGNSSFITQNF